MFMELIETFDNMLTELYDNLDQNNEIIAVTLPEPKLQKSGTNFIWKNVKEFLKLTNHHPDHFITYLNKNYNFQANWITDSKSDGMIFNHKKITIANIYDYMKNYLKSYVICKSCKSYNSNLVKDQTIRKYNFVCLNCNNTYYV